jgi:ferrous iron transport protein B
MFTFALAGNPNCGKTTLFNRLTGSRAHVGNWPGVTVDRKEGFCRIGDTEVTIQDLPGIYSLSPYSEEEVVSRKYLLEEKPDLIINIVDATNFERNMYLTSQLMETGVPVVLALNMMDEIEALGDKIDVEKLSGRLNIPVVPISAAKNRGIDKLMTTALTTARDKSTFFHSVLSDTPAFPLVAEIRRITAKYNKEISLFSAIKLLEKDERIIESVALPQEATELIDLVVRNSEDELGIEWEIYVADLRYKYITKLSEECIKRTRSADELTTTDKIDKLVTNKFLAIPIFLGVMFLVFQITFGAVGSFLTDGMDYLVNSVAVEAVRALMIKYEVADWAVGLVADGIATGVGMVLVYLPQILLLFTFLSFLEDSGYMARAAFIMDKLLRGFGLSGKSFVPMLMGFGCTVPAVMAARTLENERDRRMTIILTPFMSCGARMPVYAVFAGAFFVSHKGLTVISLYCLGVAVALLSGIILKSTVLKGEAETFIMELPNYRLPTLKTIALHVWEKAKEFVVKAFTILLLASVVIWFLQSFNLSLTYVTDNSQSIFASIGKLLVPLFKPCGFGEWRASVALLTGFVAKEAVVSTLGILYGVGESASSSAISGVLAGHFTPLSAYSYLVFVLLYMPCVVAFTTIRKEMNSAKWTLFAVCYQTVAAWIVSFLVYNIGSLFLC